MEQELNLELILLKDFVIIFGLAIFVLLLFHRFKVPAIVGFLLTGVLCGPHGLALVDATEQVHVLAEIGIVVLLFTVGMEFSLKRLFLYKRFFFIAGPLQVGLVSLIGFTIGELFQRPFGESVFLGFLLSLSSTAIVMRLLQEREQTTTAQGKLAMGILIFQDIAIVPMILVVPILAGKGAELNATAMFLVAKGVLILSAAIIGAMTIVPRLLYYVARTRSRELFLLSVLVICFSVAWVSSIAGLSLSLGAFLAGLVISDSEYSSQAIGDILPVQDIFTSLFFVSIGMLLNIDFVVENPVLIVFLSIAVFTMKAVINASVALFVGMPLRLAVFAAMTLSQVGEFSFVLVMEGMEYGIGTDYLHQLFLSIAVITMGITPALIDLAPFISSKIHGWPLPASLKSRVETPDIPEKEDHVVIVGHGNSGKMLARACRDAHIPYVILDMDPETVSSLKKEGEPIFFGDATHDHVLKHVQIGRAKAIAVLVNDPIAALRIIERTKQLNQQIYTIVRTRNVDEAEVFYQTGAVDVIPDDFGSSIEVFGRILNIYDTPPEQIEQLIEELRIEGYEMLRHRFADRTIFSPATAGGGAFKIEARKVQKNSPLDHTTLKDSRLREECGVSVLFIRRSGVVLHAINAETRFFPDDYVVLFGTPSKLKEATRLFIKKEEE